AALIRAFTRKAAKHSLVFAIIFFSNFLLLAAYGEYQDMQLGFRYFIPSYIAGLFLIFSMLKNMATEALWNFAKLVFTGLLTAALFFSHGGRNIQRLNFLPYDYAMDMLSTLPENSILFVTGDNQVHPIAYTALTWKRRPDVRVFDSSGTVFSQTRVLKEKTGSFSPFDNIPFLLREQKNPVFSPSRLSARGFFESDYGILTRFSMSSLPRPYHYQWSTYPLRGVLRDKHNAIFEQQEVAASYYYKLSEKYRLSGDRAKALFLLHRSVETAPASVSILGNAAILFAENDEIKTAERILRDGLKIDPHHHILFFNLGNFYARENKFARAIRFFEQAVKENPSDLNYRLYLQRARETVQLLAARQAQEDANKSRDFLAGEKFMKEKLYPDALIYFEKDLEQNPDSARANFHVAYSHSAMKNFETALKYYERAREIDPENTSILNNLGLCYMRAGYTDKAIETLEESLDIKPEQENVIKALKKMRSR
ncbi:MAG TPA: tetratricopeptide repeat protein, partial [Firmicutes bacterium]|nr:tetratricopeptide repeat protein [Bacillota bacterium]